MRKQTITMAFFIIIFVLAGCNRAPQPTALPTLEPTGTTPPTAAPTLPPTATTAPSPTAASGSKTIDTANAGELAVSQRLELPFDPAGIVWSRDGRSLALTGYKDLLLLDAASLAVIKQITLPENEALLDFSPDGRSLAKWLDFQTITISDVLTDQVTATISTGVQFSAASFSPDGSRLVVGSGEEWAAMIYDTASGELLDTVTGFETAAPVYNVRFGSDGASLVWMARGSIQVEQIAGQMLGADIGHEDFITAYHLSHSGSLLATAAGGMVNGEYTPLVHLWDPSSGEKTGELLQPQPAYCVEFSPDDALLAVCAGDDLLLWDVSSQALVLSAPAHAGGIWAARFSPDGLSLATVGADRALALWTVE